MHPSYDISLSRVIATHATYFSNLWYNFHQFPHPNIGRPRENSECFAGQFTTSEQSKYFVFDNFSRFGQFRAIVVMKPINCFEIWKGGRFDTTTIPEGGSAVGRTIWCSGRGEGHAPLLYSTTTDPGNGISPSPGSWRHSLHRRRAPASNSNSGACYASVLSRPAALPGVSVLSESELTKVHQELSDAYACAVAVIAAW